MSVTLSPVGGVAAQFFSNDGVPLAGGLIYTYLAGTSTPAATYTSAAGAIAHSNPIVLDSAGRVPSGEIWLDDAVVYKFVLKDASSVLIATYDNITGINSNFVNYINQQEIQTATAGQTVFTLTTMTYLPGTNSLSVFVDGVNQYGPGAQYAYVETNSTTITFESGLHVGALVKFTTSQQQSAGVVDATQVSYEPPFTNSVATNVAAKLAQTINVSDFGAVGDGSTDDTTAIQNSINSLESGQTLIFDKNYKVIGLTITNKSRIRLTGKGRVFLSSAASGAYLFQLVGTIDDLEIDTMTLAGEGNSGYSQVAIGCNSGQTVSNTRFHDLNINNINVGLSHNANLGGSWTNGWAYNNYFENILGTVAGSGYGIQAAKAYNLHIYGNTINNASRHSIYVGRGQNLACLIENNIIINHRKDVFDGSPRCSIDVGRVSGVTIANNTFQDCYDGQIYLGADTSTGDDCSDILIIGNKFGTPKNAVPCIWAGEQLVPTTNFLYKIDILDNTFEQDCDATVANVINLLNGTQITIKNNRLRAYNVTSTLPTFVNVGDTLYISNDSHINDVMVSDNVATSDKGSTVAGSRFLYIVDQLCTGSSFYTAKNNSFLTWEVEYYFEATPVNLNSKLKFTESVDYTFVISPQSTSTAAFSIIGVKPTSQITVRPQYSVQVAPQPIYAAYANDNNPNAITIAASNPTTSTSTQVLQTILVFVEDF